MKNLILIRHAKSSWDAPLNDFERPLMNSGVRDAHLVSTNAVRFLPKKYVVWSSSARRAAETALIFTQNFSFPVENINFKKELYTFDEYKLEQIIADCSDDIENLIVFGHNEAITNFVNKFGDRFIDNVTTSGFVSITFETNSWKNLSNGKIIKIIFPRDFR